MAETEVKLLRAQIEQLKKENLHLKQQFSIQANENFLNSQKDAEARKKDEILQLFNDHNSSQANTPVRSASKISNGFSRPNSAVLDAFDVSEPLDDLNSRVLETQFNIPNSPIFELSQTDPIIRNDAMTMTDTVSTSFISNIPSTSKNDKEFAKSVFLDIFTSLDAQSSLLPDINLLYLLDKALVNDNSLFDVVWKENKVNILITVLQTVINNRNESKNQELVNNIVLRLLEILFLVWFWKDKNSVSIFPVFITPNLFFDVLKTFDAKVCFEALKLFTLLTVDSESSLRLYSEPDELLTVLTRFFLSTTLQESPKEIIIITLDLLSTAITSNRISKEIVVAHPLTKRITYKFNTTSLQGDNFYVLNAYVKFYQSLLCEVWILLPTTSTKTPVVPETNVDITVRMYGGFDVKYLLIAQLTCLISWCAKQEAAEAAKFELYGDEEFEMDPDLEEEEWAMELEVMSRSKLNYAQLTDRAKEVLEKLVGMNEVDDYSVNWV
ncbi:hypothetical protein HK098_008156 [Nowakowskiella sp. JEL0407]|nr:hypothetical protein HK098_008156 [Nowakowskiella sp. JEL0407]